MTIRSGYYSLEEAATGLGVKKPTLYYYIKTFAIEPKKFPLDKHKYIAEADFERVRMAKEDAKRSNTKDAA